MIDLQAWVNVYPNYAIAETIDLKIGNEIERFNFSHGNNHFPRETGQNLYSKHRCHLSLSVLDDSLGKGGTTCFRTKVLIQTRKYN